MLVLWFTGLFFAVSISSASSNVFPRVRLRDKQGRLRSQSHQVFVTAKDSPLHMSRFPLNKHGYESLMMPRRSPGSVFFVNDADIEELLKQQNNRGKSKKQADFQPIAVLLNSRDSDSDKRSRSHIKSYDVEKILAKLSSYKGNVKSLVQDAKRVKKSKRNPSISYQSNYKSNKNSDSVAGDNNIIAMLNKIAAKELHRVRNLKKVLNNQPQYRNNYEQKFGALENDLLLSEIKVAAIKEMLKRALKREVKEYNNPKSSIKKKRAQSSPFDSNGMMFITKPKEKREPNLNALLEKAVKWERSGPERSHRPQNADFTADEIKSIDRITTAIENDDRSFEQLNESVEKLDQQIERDDLSELQRVKDKILPKSARTKDANADQSEQYFGKIAELIQARDDTDPVFDFNALVA